jgi:hypothetical protein
MKLATFSNRIFSIVLFVGAMFCQRAGADTVLSNLGDQWTSGGIGDIHALFPGGTPYGSDTANFTTGNSAYSLDSITLEFEFSSVWESGLGPAPGAVKIQLLQGNTVLGTFGHPVADPATTQWPIAPNHAYTLFIDFTPTAPIRLNPDSPYSLNISMPANSGTGAALMFTRSSDYISSDGWVMGATASGDPYAGGEHLKVAVGATAVPDSANTAVLLSVGLAVLIWGRRKLRKEINSPAGNRDV